MANTLVIKLDVDSRGAVTGFRAVGQAGDGAGEKITNSFGKARHGVESISRTLQETRQQLIAFFSVRAIADGVRSLVKAQVQMQQIHFTLLSATGSAEAANKAFDFVSHTSEELGLHLRSSALAFAQLSAAAHANGVAMAKQEALFTAFGRASTVLHLSAQNSQSALMALQQMFSKGTVQAQELRLQLGQAIPGVVPRFIQAVMAMRKANGKANVSFDKLLQSGQLVTKDVLPALITALNQSSDGWQEAANGLNANIARVSNAWFELKTAFSQGLSTSAATGGLHELADLMRVVAEHANVVIDVVSTIGAVAALNFGGRALTALASYTRNMTKQALATTEAAAAERKNAAAMVAGAQARSTELTRTLEAVKATRDETAAKLAAAQADIRFEQRHLQAARVAGVLSGALREERMALNGLTVARARQAEAINTMAVLGRQEARVQAELTTASSAQIAAQTRLASSLSRTQSALSMVKRAGSSLFALIGGWPGLILAAGAAFVYLATRQTEAEKTAASLKKTTDELAKAQDHVTVTAIHEGKAQLKAAQAAVVAAKAKLAQAEAERNAPHLGTGYDIAADAAARAEEHLKRLKRSVQALGDQVHKSQVALGLSMVTQMLGQSTQQETNAFDSLRKALVAKNAQVQKEIETFGKGTVEQIKYAEATRIAAEKAKGDTNVTRARIATIKQLYAPLIKNAELLETKKTASKNAADAERKAEQTSRAHKQAIDALNASLEAYRDKTRQIEQATQDAKDKLAGMTQAQIDYRSAVRDAVAEYDQLIAKGERASVASEALRERVAAAQGQFHQAANATDDLATATDHLGDTQADNTGRATAYYNTIADGARNISDTLTSVFTGINRTAGNLWHQLADAAKQVVQQIISTFLQLRVIGPILDGVFGRQANGTGVITSALGGTARAFGVGGGNASSGAAAASGKPSYLGLVSTGGSAYKAYGWLTGKASGSAASSSSTFIGPTGAGAYTGQGAISAPGYYMNGANPYGGALDVHGGALGGGYSVPYASIGGGVLGAYYGYERSADGRLAHVGRTATYGALGAGIAGTAAGVAGGASLGAAAGGAFGAAAGMSWIPIVGWAAAAAALLDLATGGGLFGTGYEAKNVDTALELGPGGPGASVTAALKKKKSLFRGSKWTEREYAASQDIQDAAGKLYDTIRQTMVDGARSLNTAVPDMISAALHVKTDAKGKNAQYVVDYMGQTWKEATSEAATKRIGAEALLKVVQSSAGDVVQSIADKWRDSADTLAAGAQMLIAAQADLTHGRNLLALSAGASLKQVAAFTEQMQQSGETLAQTYARLAQASQQYRQFVGQFSDKIAGAGLGAVLAQINAAMQQDIQKANDLARAAGLQGAKEKDLANIHQAAAQQAADAMAKLGSAADQLATKLYAATGNTLDAVTAQFDKLQDKVKASTQMALGDLSPLGDQEKLDLALKGLRSGTTSAQDVLSIGKRLYATGSDYRGLYDKVQSILGQPSAATASGMDTINSQLDKLNALGQRKDWLQGKADAAQRAGDAKTLAGYVADLATARGQSFGDVAGNLGFSLKDLAKDLGTRDIKGYLAKLQDEDIPGSLGEASTEIVGAIRGIGRDIVQAITGAPIANVGPAPGVSARQGGTNDDVLIAIDGKLAQLIDHSADTAKTNREMSKTDKQRLLRDAQTRPRVGARIA